MRFSLTKVLWSVVLLCTCLLFGSLLYLGNLYTNNIEIVCKNEESHEPKNAAQTRPIQGSIDRQVHLIIIARWRYGSSFTGDIFNNNHDFSYFYEPLRGKQYKADVEKVRNRVINESQITMLHDILKCEFTDKKYTWWDDEDTNMNCWRSRKFEASVLCKNSKPSRRVRRNETSRMVEEICRSGKHVAIKTVRVPDLKYLKSIVMDDSLNVKVIQLVRDPRRVYLSRKPIDFPDMELSECDELKNNLKYWKDPPSWLNDRYMLLRYEDLRDEPIEMVQIIYDFLGLLAPEHIKTWLLLNEYSRRTKIKKLNYDEMVHVQEYCMETLLMMGYKAMNSTTRYQRDLNTSIGLKVKLSYPLMPNMTFKQK
ncbi:carbohydrate sulfotransferase 1-like [Amphiura filiformis]|uniref:carbohydrate sulfotransferase 1-like n=1 Tax=Amphiura filiformis TaxID=82378 RepID=UPI003B20F6B8